MGQRRRRERNDDQEERAGKEQKKGEGRAEIPKAKTRDGSSEMNRLRNISGMRRTLRKTKRRKQKKRTAKRKQRREEDALEPWAAALSRRMQLKRQHMDG